MHQTNTYPSRSPSESSDTTSSSRSTLPSTEGKRRRNFSNPLAFKLFSSGSSKSASPPFERPKSHRRHCSASAAQHQDLLQSTRSGLESSFSVDQHHHYPPPDQMSPRASSPQSPKEEYAAKRASFMARKNSDEYRRDGDFVNHYGRHSNDWLFGGFSVRETVRDRIEKLRHHEKES